MQKEISQAVIRRMPRYYRYLGELLDDGVERISSNELSVRMKVTASQIRQFCQSAPLVGRKSHHRASVRCEPAGWLCGI